LPIEYAQWQQVIDAIKNKIIKVRSRPTGPKREKELQFFSSAADQCDYMKEIWRNEISHTLRWYKKEEALGVINRVREFVNLVGEHQASTPATDAFQQVIASAVADAQRQQPMQFNRLTALAALAPRIEK
jgi:hypothetical protein